MRYDGRVTIRISRAEPIHPSHRAHNSRLVRAIDRAATIFLGWCTTQDKLGWLPVLNGMVSYYRTALQDLRGLRHLTDRELSDVLLGSLLVECHGERTVPDEMIEVAIHDLAYAGRRLSRVALCDWALNLEGGYGGRADLLRSRCPRLGQQHPRSHRMVLICSLRLTDLGWATLRFRTCRRAAIAALRVLRDHPDIDLDAARSRRWAWYFVTGMVRDPR